MSFQAGHRVSVRCVATLAVIGRIMPQPRGYSSSFCFRSRCPCLDSVASGRGTPLKEDSMRKTHIHFAGALLSVAVLGACATAVRTVPARTTRVVVVSADEDRSQLRVPPGH